MNITESRIDQERVIWLSPDVAVVAYRWTGKGTYQRVPVPSPTYASTIYAKQRNGLLLPRLRSSTTATRNLDLDLNLAAGLYLLLLALRPNLIP